MQPRQVVKILQTLNDTVIVKHVKYILRLSGNVNQTKYESSAKMAFFCVFFWIEWL